MKEQIAACCKRLRLSKNIPENYQDISACTHEEFLLKLLQNEVCYRDANRRERLIKQAKFFYHKTFDGFSFEDIRIPSELSIEELKNVSFIDDKRNLILYGNVGTGKTHLAIAIGIEACNQNKPVMFFRTAALVNQLNRARENDELDKFYKKINKAELIICDEWGYVPLDREGSQLLFQLISDCYEKKSLIITTNLEFTSWVNIFYDEQMTSAMIDRLIHHSYLLIFEGESYRIKNSLMKGVE